MKGIVFNLLEEVVIRELGADAWDNLLDGAKVGGSYTSLGSYPDDDMIRLVITAASALNQTPQEVLRWFGRNAMSILADRYPGFFTSCASTRPFVLSLNHIIHPEVRKVYPGADVPVFDFRDEADGRLGMGYNSHRKLCALAHGFVEGAADYYCEAVEVEESQCMHNGAAKCVFHMAFRPLAQQKQQLS